MIDHLVFASNDLPGASATIVDLFGVAPTTGGSHVGKGTHNELLSLGGATYLEVIGCALPFIIDWRDSPHPTETLPAAVHLVELVVVHPDPRRLRAVLEIIGAGSDVEVHEGDRAALRATIAAASGNVTLTS